MKKVLLLILFSLPVLVYAGEEYRMEVHPLEDATIIGGRETILPRVYLYQDGKKTKTKIEISTIQYLFNGKEIYAANEKPHWIKHDFTFEPNGLSVLEILATDEKGNKHHFKKELIVSNVNVIVRAKLNTPLPEGREIYIAGSPTVLSKPSGDFNPTGAKFRQIGKDLYEVNFIMGLNNRVTFETTLGSWALKGRDEKENVIRPNIKITKPNQVINVTIDNFGKLKGKISATGYVIGYQGDPDKLNISYTHKDESEAVLAWRYNEDAFTTMKTENTQFSRFLIPFEQGKKLEFSFSPFKKTNTMDIPLMSYPFNFLVVGDIRISAGSKIPRLIGKEKDISFVIDTGDIVFSGLNAVDWHSFFSIFRPIIENFLYQPAVGNHEEETPLYTPVMGKPWWYHYTWGNSLFISINNNSPHHDQSAQYIWLEQTLKKYQDMKFKFVSFHVPVYTSRSKGNSDSGIKYLAPLFEKYGVNVVFNGDDHGYERSHPIIGGKVVKSGGVIYVVTAGGGAPLYDLDELQSWSAFEKKTFHYMKASVYEDKVIFNAIDDKGKVFDSFTIK